MSDMKLTDELKQMNAYWRLLAGLINEGLGIVKNSQITPEARLEQLRGKLEFAQQYTRELPPSVRAELDTDPRVQATFAAIAAGHTRITGARALPDGEIQPLRQNDDRE